MDGGSDPQAVPKPAVDESSYVSKAIHQKEEAQIAEQAKHSADAMKEEEEEMARKRSEQLEFEARRNSSMIS